MIKFKEYPADDPMVATVLKHGFVVHQLAPDIFKKIAPVYKRICIHVSLLCLFFLAFLKHCPKPFCLREITKYF